jgi:alpha-amylase
MQLKPLLFLALIIWGMGACKSNHSDSSEMPIENHWPHAGITYEIFVQSFHDTNGDGIGDINGVIEKLDYIQELGANAIWLMPIMPSPTYHKYDVTDYKDIHPDYGTLDDFKRLIEEAHQRNIKIVIDLIINHTSNQHPWFLDAQKSRDSKFRDYYVWAQKDTIADYLNKKVTTLDSDNIQQWHDPGFGKDYYYGFFWGGMPDLNFDNSAVKEEIFDIGRFWLNEVGVDGFRLDAAKHIFPDDRPLDNHSFWKEFRAEMVKVKPDIYLVGEVYDKKEIVAPYLPGLPALFNFDFHYTLLEAYAKEDGMLLANKQSEVLNFYQNITKDFIDATFSSNHDQPRLLGELGNDPLKHKQAILILMSMPGAPYLYYGEEIGMLGKKPDENIREPFLWDVADKDIGRTKWINPVYTTDETVVPLEIQKNDPNSYFNFYKAVIKLRNTNRALAIGNLELLKDSFDKALMIYQRNYEKQNLLVVHNIGSSTKTLTIPQGYQHVVYALNGAEIKGKEAELPRYSSLILHKK